VKQWTQLNQAIVDCRQCPRLTEHCLEVARVKRRAFMDCEYWGRPVPNFGDPRAQLLIVGLAPAAHGANRTGRMFTGDRSGLWLYRALHKAGFANQPTAESADDGLALSRCAVTAVCHCAPPANKPTSTELAACARWFAELLSFCPARVFLCLGQIAWKQTIREIIKRGWYEGKQPPFAHGAEVELANGRWLLASYHPSQQNTFTGRLTESMFDHVFARAKAVLSASS
jgi:uracil-DNA glycosylase family 4